MKVLKAEQYKIINGEPICAYDCPRYGKGDWECSRRDKPCIPGLREQRDALKADLDAANKRIAELMPYRQLYFARNPHSEPLEPFTDDEMKKYHIANSDKINESDKQ